jgi:hypothetical protein
MLSSYPSFRPKEKSVSQTGFVIWITVGAATGAATVVVGVCPPGVAAAPLEAAADWAAALEARRTAMRLTAAFAARRQEI